MNFNIRKTPSLNKKRYACIYNKHAQNYTKYAQNGAFTNGTPYIADIFVILLCYAISDLFLQPQIRNGGITNRLFLIFVVKCYAENTLKKTWQQMSKTNYSIRLGKAIDKLLYKKELSS